MKTLITGANGYIGNHLVEKVLLQGVQVNAFLLEGTDLHALENLPVQVFKGDIRREQDLEAAVEGCDTVYHLASLVGLWAKDPHSFYDINVTGTDTLLRVCLRKGVRRVVVVSSCGVFGFSKNGQLLDETVDNGHNLNDPYEKSKFKQVEVSKKYLRTGMEVVFVYLTKVFGPGIKSNGNSITGIFEGMLDGTWRIIPGNGNTTANFAFVDDVVAGLVLAMQNGTSGEHYMLGGENLSYHQLFDIVKAMSGRDFQLRHVPYPVLWLVGGVQELLAKWTGKPPFITKFGARKFTSDALVSCEKAKRELSYKITPASLAIGQTLSHLQNKKTADSLPELTVVIGAMAE